ncbi:acylphosphatase [Calidifontibacter sp. DB0510]|uniref:acylphosphatase n=1 Tax=Metallococcus carri TaxID=1656884 RepID=A0A967AZQ3_9MICO|nr:acylphosphatase [Metallococcus carri]NHN54733.1 acylphosphatase [Metallococcus carri]NOP37078.1 acylphosphatase [Calidifontibacter sp. DB2511S]
MTIAVDIRVTGQVQGVSFRYYCAQEARRLGVTGQVANESDGSVSGHFEGDQQAVEDLVAWCRTGSPSASVEDVQATPAQVRGDSEFTTG